VVVFVLLFRNNQDLPYKNLIIALEVIETFKSERDSGK